MEKFIITLKEDTSVTMTIRIDRSLQEKYNNLASMTNRSWNEPIYTRPWPDVTGTMYADYRKTQVVKVAVYGEDELQLIAYCGWAGDSDDSNAIMHNAICIYQGQYVIINEALFEIWINGINPEYN